MKPTQRVKIAKKCDFRRSDTMPAANPTAAATKPASRKAIQ